MIIRFVFRDYNAGGYEVARPAEMYWSDRVPVEGEQIEADGSHLDMPAQTYYVKQVRWLVGTAGPNSVQVDLHPQDLGAFREQR